MPLILLFSLVAAIGLITLKAVGVIAMAWWLVIIAAWLCPLAAIFAAWFFGVLFWIACAAGLTFFIGLAIFVVFVARLCGVDKRHAQITWRLRGVR